MYNLLPITMYVDPWRMVQISLLVLMALTPTCHSPLKNVVR